MNLESVLIGESSAVKKLRKELAQLAKTKSHVVLYGPTGTGKKTVAAAIHDITGMENTIVTLNPSSTPESEIRTVLEKTNLRASSLVIQNIERFSFLNQATFSNFINKLDKKTPLHVIITCGRKIADLKKAGKLLDGLYESIKSFEQLEVPPLNSRSEDIPLFIEHFVKNTCDGLGMNLKALDINALDFLVRREWKENVRELKSVIEQAVLSSQEDIIELPQNLVDEHTQLNGMVENINDRKPFLFDRSLSNLEKILIERTLDAVAFNQTKAAEILNVSESNLRYRLKKFKIVPSRQK